MNHRKTLSTYSVAALIAALVAEPMLARAASCSGQRVNWGSTSVASCGIFGPTRARSFGEFNSCAGCPTIPFRLSVELFDGIHAFAFAFNSAGLALQNCFPFDDTEGDGREFVQGAGCISGAKHHVAVVF